MSYDKEQKSELVKQHKRIAMGVPLTGQSMQPKETNKKEPALTKKK